MNFVAGLDEVAFGSFNGDNWVIGLRRFEWISIHCYL